MCRKLIYMISFVLLLGCAGNSAVAELVAYWPLDEGSGTTAGDASGNGHDGTIMGNDVEWVQSMGGYGTALDFPGNWGQYVDTGTWNPSAATGNITVAFWMNWGGDNGGHQGVVAKRDGWAEPDTMWCIEISQSSLMMNWHRFGSWVDVGISPPVGEWMHVAITFDGTTVTAYTDGNLHATAGGFSFGPATSAHVVFGAVEPDNNPFNGILDEVRIYDNALSQGEITALSTEFSATAPNPADGAVVAQTSLALMWTAGAFADTHRVYFGENYDDVLAGTPDTDKGPQTWTVLWVPDLELGKTYYWRVEESSATHPDSPWRGDVWSFTIPQLTAWRPIPADGSEFIDPNVTLEWSAGMNALLHHVYFGDNLDDVSNADISDTTGIYRGPLGAGQESYDPGPLEFERVYYWRIDAFDGLATHKGDVWSFKTTVLGLGAILREVWEDIGGDAVADLTSNPSYPDSPSWSDEITEFDFWDLGLDEYGARLRGWLYVPVAGDYTFWITSDNGSELWLSSDDDPGGVGTAPIAQVPGTNWTGHYEWEKFPEQKSAPITLESGRYYIEALLKEGGGGDGVVVAWEGPAAPEREAIPGGYLMPFEALWASGPSPANRVTGVTQSPTLSWEPGEKAMQHDVYFGTDQDAVANADTTTAGVYRGRQGLAFTSYVPPESPLQWNTNYYWRIDEVNTLDPDGLWQGSVWRFTTADFVIVDDFEDYNDYSPDRIFQTWIDGFGYSEPAPGKAGNGTGSTVGYLSPPFAEQTIVHGGGQSMPFGYDNTGTGGKARYSEAEREWTIQQDWTQHGVKVLVLWFYGDLANAPATLYVGIEDVTGARKDVPHSNPDALRIPSWQEWNVDLGDFTNVNLSAVKKLYVGVGNRLTPAVGGTGNLFIDDISLYLPRCLASVLKPDADLNSDCIVDYLDVEVMANAWLGTGYVVTPQQPSATGLVGYYALENNTQDGSGGGHNGTAQGAPMFVPGPAGYGMGMEFDGTGGQYVDLGTWDPTAATGQLTAALWVKWHGLSGFYQGLIAKRDTWAQDDMMWQVEANVDTGNISAGRESGQGVGGYGVAVVGEWEHLAFSFDGTTGTLYRDGWQVGSGAFSLGPDTEAALVFGAVEGNGGNPFNGALDEIRLYNRALSQAEIAWLAGRTAPFSAAFDMNVDDTVDFLDVAVLADAWLDEQLWPTQ